MISHFDTNINTFLVYNLFIVIVVVLLQVASRDAEVRVLKADLHSQQKKCSHQEKYVSILK